jgi:hypothetical protein
MVSRYIITLGGVLANLYTTFDEKTFEALHPFSNKRQKMILDMVNLRITDRPGI